MKCGESHGEAWAQQTVLVCKWCGSNEKALRPEQKSGLVYKGLGCVFHAVQCNNKRRLALLYQAVGFNWDANMANMTIGI